MATKQDPEREDDGKFHHGCGETFTHAAWYSKHALHCDGKPVQTRGRIERLAARAGRALVPVTAARKPTTRRSTPIPAPTSAAAVGAVAAAATDKAMELTIVGLRAQRAKIDVAIEALMALRV